MGDLTSTCNAFLQTFTDDRWICEEYLKHKKELISQTGRPFFPRISKIPIVGVCFKHVTCVYYIDPAIHCTDCLITLTG